MSRSRNEDVWSAPWWGWVSTSSCCRRSWSRPPRSPRHTVPRAIKAGGNSPAPLRPRRTRGTRAPRMGARTTAREGALQMLFAIDASGTDVERAIAEFWRELPGDAEDRAYADEAVRGVHGALASIDERIAKASTNWRVERMARVDRNVLRLGAWELGERREVPRAVVLDEAVEIAKRFGTEESGAFVNGVLDRIADDLGRKDDDRPRSGSPPDDRPPDPKGE